MNEKHIDMTTLAAEREKTIIRTSIIGIVTNVFLAAFKAAVGIISNSIAVTLDAVNNLSDALSSIITIIGAKLGSRMPDKKHPLGHGRSEYISSMLVAAIVLYAGITSMVESIKKIIHPEEADYSTVSLVIIAVAIVVKLILGRYVKKKGEAVNSGALVASGQDASFDAILSASVLASAIIFLIWHISLEAYVGVIISVVIIKAGVEMMLETLDDILGHRSDAELTGKIKMLVNEEPEVRGAYDLFLHNYGPNKNYGSVHIELPDTMNAEEIDRLSRRLQLRIYKETGVIMTGIGVYSFNTKDDEAAHMREAVRDAVMAHEGVLQIHAFYANLEEKTIRFDVVLSFDVDPKETLVILCEEVKKMYPDYEVEIAPDLDVTD